MAWSDVADAFSGSANRPLLQPALQSVVKASMKLDLVGE